MDQPEAYLGRLKRIYIFRGLQDAELLEVAEQLEVETFPAGEVIFEEGDEGQSFYIINRGRVKVLRKRPKGEPAVVAGLEPGDFFGEGALLYGRKRSATIKAETDLEVLELDKEDFEDLLRRFPRIKPNLLVTQASYELYRRQRWNWLEPNEVVYFITRKHRVVLLQMLILPFLVGGLLALAAVWLSVWLEREWIAWAGAALEIPVALWFAWQGLDWSNDYYIVTNKRVVWQEKIVALYDSRLESPLGSIMSVNVKTDSAVERLLNMGDVVVTTYSGSIVFRSVEAPGALAALIEEHWHRTRSRDREREHEQIRRALRERLTPAPAKPAEAPPVRPPAPGKPPARQPRGSMFGPLFSLRVRFEQGGNVVYRKHWFMLALHVWKPTLALLGLLAVVTLAAAGLLPGGFALPAVLLAAIVVGLPIAGWWLYEYMDWHNDIYMVTGEQILDIIKKPLGAENKKAAPLANILGLKYERPGLVSRLLNFGDVVAIIPGAEFRFSGVFDPLSVQNDIYRRIEAFNARKTQAEAAKRNEEIAEWIEMYHGVHDELDHQRRAGDARP